MNVFLFGIGGTGARVLRSLTYCLAADMGDLPAGVNFVPMIIDHDADNKDKETAVRALETYKKSNLLRFRKEGQMILMIIEVFSCPD